jgi:DNA-binding transcriptional regulator GbsR (MarR family)
LEISAIFIEPPSDAWEMYRVLAEERRRREIEPMLSMPRNALLETPTGDAERHAQELLCEMHDLNDQGAFDRRGKDNKKEG